MPEQSSLEQKISVLIAEYEALQEARALVTHVTDNRVNFFFATTSAMSVIVALLSQLVDQNVLIVTFLIVSVILLLLGVVTYVRAIEGRIANLIYIRGMNRIRRFFVTLFPDIKPYVLLPIRDDIPKFQSVGFSVSKTVPWFTLASLIGIINSALVGSILGVATYLFIVQVEPITVGVVGIITFLISLLIHQGFLVHRLRKAESEVEVKFPNDLVT